MFTQLILSFALLSNTNPSFPLLDPKWADQEFITRDEINYFHSRFESLGRQMGYLLKQRDILAKANQPWDNLLESMQFLEQQYVKLYSKLAKITGEKIHKQIETNTTILSKPRIRTVGNFIVDQASKVNASPYTSLPHSESLGLGGAARYLVGKFSAYFLVGLQTEMHFPKRKFSASAAVFTYLMGVSLIVTRAALNHQSETGPDIVEYAAEHIAFSIGTLILAPFSMGFLPMLRNLTSAKDRRAEVLFERLKSLAKTELSFWNAIQSEYPEYNSKGEVAPRTLGFMARSQFLKNLIEYAPWPPFKELTVLDTSLNPELTRFIQRLIPNDERLSKFLTAARTSHQALYARLSFSPRPEGQGGRTNFMLSFQFSLNGPIFFQVDGDMRTAPNSTATYADFIQVLRRELEQPDLQCPNLLQSIVRSKGVP